MKIVAKIGRPTLYGDAVEAMLNDRNHKGVLYPSSEGAQGCQQLARRRISERNYNAIAITRKERNGTRVSIQWGD